MVQNEAKTDLPCMFLPISLQNSVWIKKPIDHICATDYWHTGEHRQDTHRQTDGRYQVQHLRSWYILRETAKGVRFCFILQHTYEVTLSIAQDLLHVV